MPPKEVYSIEERRSFADYINGVLKDDPDLSDILPLDPYSDDLFKAASQTVLLWYARFLCFYISFRLILLAN